MIWRQLESMLPEALLSNPSVLYLKQGVNLDHDLKPSYEITLTVDGVEYPYELKMNRVAVQVPLLVDGAIWVLFLASLPGAGLAWIRGGQPSRSGR